MSQTPSGDTHSPRSDEAIEDILERFELAWQGGVVPRIDDFLPPPADETPAAAKTHRELLEELIKIDLEYRWRRGASDRSTSLMNQGAASGDTFPRRLSLEDYAARFPQLPSAEGLSLDLIVEEYRVRRRWGDRPPQSVFLDRFPQFGMQLAAALERVDRETLPSRKQLSDTNAVDTDVVLAPSTSNPLPTVRSAVPPTPADNVPMPAKIGRYVVRGQLGRGGFGTVYLGFDEELQRQVAIKVPRADRFRSSGGVQAFFREARLAAQLRHDALVDVYDVGRSPDGSCYIVMQFIDGRPLNVILAQERVSPQQAASWIARVAEAVHCAHKIGLVHGDLKPANILIDREGHPHVADFGLAIAEQEQPEQAGFVSGTPAYMAPEQVRGERHRLDGRTDLWSLGVMLYEMLTGRRPFVAPSVQDLFEEIQQRDPKPPRQMDDAITPDLEWVCLKCLSKRVADRYTTGMDLVMDLRQTMTDSVLESLGGPASIVGRSLSIDRGRDAQNWAPGNRQSTSSSRSKSARPTNIPTMQTSFIGRDRELIELSVLVMDAPQHLVTVIGPGGMGKTRLALRVGEEMLEQMAGGCWFADLRDARTAEQVSHVVAAALGVQLTSGEAPEQVVGNILEYRKPLLLILDNFEQAVEAAEATVGTWRARAPHATFLITSRAALGLAGEREYELGPLSVPAAEQTGTMRPESLTCYDSVRLFCQRAAEAQAGFELDEENMASVAAICAELEGIPLAVELAAARVKVLKPAQIAQKLNQKFQLLQSSRRDLTPRQQTLWGAIDWSFELLKEWEKHVFMQACIFQGGFNLESAESIIDLNGYPDAPMTLDCIDSLRDKSLLTVSQTKYETRFNMYASVREYGQQQWQKLAEPARQRSLAERFAARFVAFAEGWNRKLLGPAGPEALDRLRQETGNLFAVQDRALENDDPDTAARAILSIARSMAVRGPADQRAPRLDRSLAALGKAEPKLAIQLATAAAEAHQAIGRWDRALELADQAAADAAELGAKPLLVAALRLQGELRRQRGDNAAATLHLTESELLARELGDQRGVALALASRAFLLRQQGHNDQALARYAEADMLVQDVGDMIASANIARGRGHVLAQQGDYNGALRCYAEAEALARNIHDERTLCLAVGNRGMVLADRGDYAGATECYQLAEQLARKNGDKRGIAINVGNRGILYRDRGDPQASLACYREAESLNREVGSKFGVAVNLGNRGNALADLGHLAEALRCYDEAEASNRASGNKFLLALNLSDRAWTLHQQGETAAAREKLHESLLLLAEAGAEQGIEAFDCLAVLAQVEAALGNSDEARRRAVDALALAERLELTDSHPKVRIREHLTALRTAAAPASP
ncbi:MAG: protein kinase [Pirellulales bacterium]